MKIHDVAAGGLRRSPCGTPFKRRALAAMTAVRYQLGAAPWLPFFVGCPPTFALRTRWRVFRDAALPERRRTVSSCAGGADEAQTLSGARLRSRGRLPARPGPFSRPRPGNPLRLRIGENALASYA
jgi:hypothetical protein